MIFDAICISTDTVMISSLIYLPTFVHQITFHLFCLTYVYDAAQTRHNFAMMMNDVVFTSTYQNK